MQIIYNLLLIIHVLAAIIGIGSTSTFAFLIAHSNSADQLRWSYFMISKLGILPKYADIILLLSGAIMIKLGKYSVLQLWIISSFLLFVILKIMTDAWFPTKLKDIETKINQLDGDMNPNTIKLSLHRIFVSEYVINGSIVILMLIKP